MLLTKGHLIQICYRFTSIYLYFLVESFLKKKKVKSNMLLPFDLWTVNCFYSSRKVTNSQVAKTIKYVPVAD